MSVIGYGKTRKGILYTVQTLKESDMLISESVAFKARCIMRNKSNDKRSVQ